MDSETRKTFIVGGKTITIYALSDDIDKALISLYGAYFAQGVIEWNEFEEKAMEFFDNTTGNILETSDHYFANFMILSNEFANSAKFDEAERIWQLALQPMLNWEQSGAGRRLHKGFAYYRWAVIALQRGELDKGYALMHQALEEDILTHGMPVPRSAAMGFVSLNFSQVEQAVYPWMLQQMQFLNELQNTYSSIYSPSFQLKHFIARFLENPPNTETLFLFAYVVARLMQFRRIPDHSLKSRFAGQLELSVLFNLTLVIDAAIKAKNPKGSSFFDHAKFLLKRGGYPLTHKELSEINKDVTAGFDSTIKALLDQTYTFSTGSHLEPLQRDVALAYGLRNHSAHQLMSAPIVWGKFPKLQQALVNVLFATVEHLY